MCVMMTRRWFHFGFVRVCVYNEKLESKRIEVYIGTRLNEKKMYS